MSRSRHRLALAVGLVGSVVITVALVLALKPSYPDQDNNDGGAERKRKEHPGFREAARESGITFRMAFLPDEQGQNFKINLYDHGCGVAVADFDNDGHEDIYFVNQLGPNALYKNNGDGTFTDVTEQTGVGLGDRICVGATFADYDNDGYPDLFVTSTRGGNVLFLNEPVDPRDPSKGRKFVNVTKKAGLECIPARHSQTAVFFDYDNDGYLDLLVTNTAQWTLDKTDVRARYYPGVAQL